MTNYLFTGHDDLTDNGKNVRAIQEDQLRPTNDISLYITMYIIVNMKDVISMVIKIV